MPTPPPAPAPARAQHHSLDVSRTPEHHVRLRAGNDDDDDDDDDDDVPLGLRFSTRRPAHWPWRLSASSPTASSAPLLPGPPTSASKPRATCATKLLALLALLAAVPSICLIRTALYASTSVHAVALDPSSPAATRNLSRPHLLGGFLTSSDYQLVDPFLLSHASVNAQTIYAPPLDMDLPSGSKSGWALHPHSSDLGVAPGPEGVNPSVVFSPQWAAEHKLAPVPAYTAITEDDSCLVQWAADGTLCSSLQQRYGAHGASHAPSHMPPIDTVFTWVNGSDPLHDHAKQYWAYCLSASDAPAHDEYCPRPYPHRSSRPGEQATALTLDPDQKSKFDRFLTDIYPLLTAAETGVHDRDYFVRRRREQIIGYSSQRFFDMGELRYAIRTAVKFLQHLGTVHLIAPDFPADSLEGMARAEAARTGQSAQKILHDHKATADLYTDPIDGSHRVGQRPSWLDSKSPSVLAGADAVTRPASSHGPELRLHHDWSLFRPSHASGTNDSAESHKAAVLPSFNSMAIESALDPGASVEAGGWQGLGVSDTLLVSNDDFFLMRPVGHSDVQSPLYGLALRFQDDLSVDAATQISWAVGGEWPGLRMASHMLDERFGRRNRRYPQHVHRSVSASLLHEMRLMFREDVSGALRARFRGVGTNVVNHHLLHNMVLERHREAALWSYVMFVLDANGDGTIDHQEFQHLRKSFRRHHLSGHDLPPGRDQGKEEVAYRAAHPGWATEEPHPARSADRVLTPRRTTIVPQKIHAAHAGLGLQSKGAASEYVFSSWDGYALAGLYRNAINLFDNPTDGMAWHRAGWPWFPPKKGAKQDPSSSGPDDGRARAPFFEDQDPDGELACTIEWKSCLVGDGLGWMNEKDAPTTTWAAESFFTRMAFESPQCGDCLLTHLVSQSGQAGLAALLPSSDRLLPGERQEGGAGEPHLPLSRTWLSPSSAAPGWRGSNFSIAQVTAESGWEGRSARLFVARLLQRYAYTMVSTPLAFERLGAGGVSYTRKLLRGILERTRTDRGPFASSPSSAVDGAEEEDHTSLALLAINDDISDHVSSHASVKVFTRWLEDTFPASKWKTPFEQ